MKSPVSVIETMLEANLTGSLVTLAEPSPWLEAPIARPTVTSSVYPIAFKNRLPKDAPSNPLITTAKALNDGSAPVSFALTSAKGVVMHRVNGLNAISGLPRNTIRAIVAELKSPKNAENSVVMIIRAEFALRSSLYWYSCSPNVMIAGPKNDDMKSPMPLPPP